MKNNGTKTNIRTILLSIFCMAILFASVISIPSFAGHTKRSTYADEIFYLRSPTLIAANETDIYCYDDYTTSINNYSAELNASGTADIKGTYALNKHISELHLTTTKLYYLSGGSLYYRSLSNLTSETKMQCDAKILDFTIVGETDLYLVCEDADPTKTYLISHTITSSNKINAGSRLNTDTALQALRLEKIEVYNNNIYAVVGGNMLYKIYQPDATMTYTSTLLTTITSADADETSAKILYLSKSTSGIKMLYASADASGRVSSTLSSEFNTSKIHIADYPLASFYMVTTSKTYFCDTVNQAVWLKNGTNQPTKIISNKSPSPAIAQIAEHTYIKLNSPSSIFAEPFSVSALMELKAGAHLTILASPENDYKDYYYCIYTSGGKNYYVYLPTTAEFTTQNKTEANINAKAIGSSNKNIYSLPSTKKDDKNTVITTIDKEATVTQTMVQTVQNDAGESFYRVTTTDGKIGYISANQVSTNYASTKQEKIKCNAKTRRATTMYITDISNGEYTEESLKELELISLNGNTRVKLNEKLNSSKKYTKVTYQNDKKETFTGYVLTADLDPDGLSVMQILGLTLVLINVIILVVILIIRKKINNAKTTTLMR